MRPRTIDVGDEQDDVATGEDLRFLPERHRTPQPSDGPSLEEWCVHCALTGTVPSKYGLHEPTRT